MAEKTSNVDKRSSFLSVMTLETDHNSDVTTASTVGTPDYIAPEIILGIYYYLFVFVFVFFLIFFFPSLQGLDLVYPLIGGHSVVFYMNLLLVCWWRMEKGWRRVGQ